MKDNGFKLAKESSRRYSVQTITDADYADDIALMANTLAQAETLLHSVERAAGGIGLHANAYMTEYMFFNQRYDISTLDGSSLNQWTSSPTEEVMSHQPKQTSTPDQNRYGQLSIGYRSYGSQTWPIK